MNRSSLPLTQVCAGRLIRGALLGTLTLLAACAAPGTSISGFDQLNLKPGDTGNCDSSPCRVFLQIPAGKGSFLVTGNEATVGTYPAGQNADLGSFWTSQAFQIQGMNVPKAYAYIPNSR
jgi:hypothetical protein